MSQTRVARAAGGVMVLILLSRLLGFIRERAIADVFGLTWETDAFRAAFNIPDLMYFLLVAGAIGSAFIPVMSGYLANGDEREAWRMASTFINATFAILVALTGLGMVFAPALAPLVAAGFSGPQLDLLVFLMRIMFPAVLFTALAGLGMGVHNVYQSFTVPLWGPIFYNIAITLGAYGLGPSYGITGMAIGTLVGAVGNFLIQVPFIIRRAGGHPWQVDLGHPGLHRMLRLMIPTVVGMSIFQVNTIVSTNLASFLDKGDITALNLANRLMQLPLGVFGMGTSMVLFPLLSRLAAVGNLEELRRTFSTGLRVVLFVTIPSGVGLVALRVPVVRLLFEVGAFGPDDTQITGVALLYFSLGLFAVSGVQLLTRVFYSLQDTLSPVRIGLLAVATNLVLSLAFLQATNLGHGGLALAFSLAAAVQFAAYLAVLRRKLGHIDGRRIAATLLRAVAASLVMGIAAHAASDLVGGRVDLGSLAGRLLQVLSGVGSGAAVYAGVGLLFRMEEMQLMSRMLWRNVWRRN